jgi:hypothetical protein
VPPGRSPSPVRFAAGRSGGRPTAGWPHSNATVAASSRISATHRRHLSKSSRETIRAGSANPTTNARTTSDTGTRRVDHRFATTFSEARSAVGADRFRRIGAPETCCAVVLAVCVGAVTGPQASGPSQSSPERAELRASGRTLDEAQSLFYNARYEAAAALTLALRVSDTEDLASHELRSSALLFQLKALLEGRPDKEDALNNCTTCPGLIADFCVEIHRGQNVARTTLRANPGDEAALFFLGKLDLNYVWLQLGPLRRKTGWDEYWEARRSLDAVLKLNPRHVRARVARAWIDYIVDTKMPWGTRWLLGGGNRKRALTDVREAAQMKSDFFSHAEAEFALWDMQVRERDITQATEVARRLAHDFPDNPEVAAFLDAREASARR